MKRLLPVLALIATPALSQAPTVGIEQGSLAGSTLAGGVRAFLGIPFATPPVGAQRWRPPQPPTGWQGTRQATSFGARCMQQPLYSDMRFRSPPSSEDCLTLNIWAPPADGAPKPVLLYIYGGGFRAGDASELRYDGASMARQGIVTITANYRLGVFGFLAHSQLSTEAGGAGSGNYGLMDQALALEWVRRNVAAFGGDPARITIAGESAGSISVSALMASPLTREKIVGAIGESGALVGPSRMLMPPADAEAEGARFAAAAGAPDIAALRAMPADRLLELTGQFRGGPTVDGIMLTEDPTVTFTQGRGARVPLLAGFNSQEGPADAVLGGAPPTRANYQAGVKRMFGDRAAAVEALYPAATDADVPWAATNLASDRFLSHGTWRWLDLHRATGAPAFMYRYERVRPPAVDAPDAPRPLGAVHSAEIEYALGNLDVNPSYRWQPEDYRVSRTFQGYVANFVKTGDPNGSGLPRWTALPRGDGPATVQVIDVDTRSRPFDELPRYRAATELFAAP